MRPGLREAALFGPAIFGLALVLAALQPTTGVLGHDYYPLFAELLIGKLHLTTNGLSIPHFTPHLCGGIPFFADPQSTFYSIPQLLTLFFQPLTAVHVTYALFYVAGYWGVLRFARGILGAAPLAAHLGAMVFLLNGFCFAHFLMGHATHHPFLLSFWFLLLLFRRYDGPRARACGAILLALLMTYTFYSGGMHVVVLFIALGVYAAPLWVRHWRHELSHGLFLLLLAAGLTLLFNAGKITAAVRYMEHAHPSPLHRSTESLFAIVPRYFWFLPGSTPRLISFGSLAFGAWEFVAFVTKLTIPALPAAVLFWLRARDPNERRERVRLALVYAGWTAALILVACGVVSESVPLLSRYHNPLKILAIGIIPLTLTVIYAVDRLLRLAPEPARRTARAGFFFVSALLCLEFSAYAGWFTENDSGLNYLPEGVGEAYTGIASRSLPPVTAVVEQRRNDVTGLLAGETSLGCMRPIFGYFGEGIRAASRLAAGPVTRVENGAFNLNRPECFLYGKELGCRAWDRLPADDPAALARFARAGTRTGAVPPWHRALLWISHLAILIAALFVAATHISGRRGSP